MLQAEFVAVHTSNTQHMMCAAGGIALSTTAEKRTQLNSFDSSSIMLGVSV
jgi:hypothetical protein